MNLRHILLRYFLPMVACFFILSFISLVPAIQNSYYPTFEEISLSAAESKQPDVYFKTQKGTEEAPNHPDKITLLFNSKAYLRALVDRAKATGQQGVYDYKEFVLSISEYFITPIIFFFSLLLVTPGAIGRKLLNFIIGSILIIGFAYLTVRFRSYLAVAESNLPGMSFDPREIKAYKLLSFAFSSVTTITIVLLIWILLAFRKSEMQKIMNWKV